MPILDHILFSPPDDLDATIWRYLDFTKYVSFLDSSELFFANVETFEDPYEGTYPKLDQATTDHDREYRKRFRAYVHVNCWHMNEHESEAMWRLYLKSNEGIAIRSTFRRLTESLEYDGEMYFGTVRYLDFETEELERKFNMLGPYVCKRVAFAHENEVRGVIPKTEEFNKHEPRIEGGIPVRVNVPEIAQEIVLSPTAPGWFKSLVEHVTDKYGYDLNVRDSALNSPPKF